MTTRKVEHMAGEFRTFFSDTHCSVCWIDDDSHIANGVVSADLVNGRWWLSRAILKPANLRNKGIGSMMVDFLKEGILLSDTKVVIVSPGGYGEDIRKQINFYKKNGFTTVENGMEGPYLEWRHDGKKASV